MGKEDPVEFDSSLLLHSDMMGVAQVEGECQLLLQRLCLLLQQPREQKPDAIIAKATQKLQQPREQQPREQQLPTAKGTTASNELQLRTHMCEAHHYSHNDDAETGL